MTGEFNVANFCLVLVTAGSQHEAIAIAQAMVMEKLAACVSLLPITSVYTWQDQLQQDQEWQLVMKTHSACFTALKERVQQLHSYEVPEIVAVPLQAGSEPYLQWIAATVQRSPLDL